ncbi:sigma 54-interacting transcriptional regulator [Camelliibacillus cellulosilyticus]|uniref:Sigma 54-interacting transcriptional regulator n=1 Tax=Camelliibacillus cellulosilyticus TaxID=2174486 RepID=A0ABV9GLD8_9BACL
MMTIAVIGYERTTIKAIMDQLYEIRLHEDFNLQALTVNDLPEIKLDKNTLVVATSKIVHFMTKPYLHAETRVIVAKRAINYGNIRDLLELPERTDVLLVSNMKDPALDTIQLLQDTGIRLNFTPFYPGADVDPAIKIAVTPGDLDHIPQTIEKVINIGIRLLDISTIIEIYNYFNMTDSSYNRLSARFFNSLISLTSQLSNEIYKTKMLRNSLEGIAHNVDEAVVLYTEDGQIEFINEKAVKLLDIQGLPIQKNVKSIMPKVFLDAFDSIENSYDVFKDVEDVTYYMRKKSIYVDHRFYGTLILFREANEIQKLEHQYRRQTKKKKFTAKYRFNDMVTANPTIENLTHIARKLAKSNATILILGETGTGKEVLAQSIHNASPRSYYPFVGVNFSAFTESLLESELFGYEGGAFTGAKKGGKSGLFEQAHKGTIFLDEIGDASPTIQQRLLRVLQEKEIMRVGGEEVIHLDVRVIAATNRNLEVMIEEGLFRQDLFYRLNVLPLYLPPLRERREDIILLTNYFLKELCTEYLRPVPCLSEKAKKAILDYHWPGNIRELRNVIEYIIHIAEDTVYAELLPFISGNKFINTNKVHSSDLERTKTFFTEKGFLFDIKEILEVLSDGDGKGLGRPAILIALQKKGILLTEQQFRYRQKLLRDYGLITVGKGRKGTQITKKGREFLINIGSPGHAPGTF